MNSFLRTINYSSSNEDSSSELHALELEAGDRVLCITGSGARVLDLLAFKPVKIISIDFNPTQNFLLELKMTAIDYLDYKKFIEFIGLQSSGNRIEVYQQLRVQLSEKAKTFWDNNKDIIQKGILYQGRWEKHFRKLSRLVGFMRTKKLRKLFYAENIEDQERIWYNEWANFMWRLLLLLSTNRVVWKYVLRDPGFYKYVPRDFSPYEYIKTKFDESFKNQLVKKSYFAQLLFFGRFELNGALPLHLQEKYYEQLKSSNKKVLIITASLKDYLNRRCEFKFNKYSLSDIASYTNMAEYSKIWDGILKTSTKDARFCERQFLVKREVPKHVQSYINRDNICERYLEKIDSSFFYTFKTGSINYGKKGKIGCKEKIWESIK